MDFELTEEQAALREVSRSLLAASCPPELVRALSSVGKDTDDKLWQRGAELGWTGLAAPEECDGAGAGLVELALVAEEIGRARSWPAAWPGVTSRQAWPGPARCRPTAWCSAAGPSRCRRRRRPTGCWWPRVIASSS